MGWLQVTRGADWKGGGGTGCETGTVTQSGGAGVEAGYVWNPVIRVRGPDDARRNPWIDKCTAPPREIREQEQQTKEARRRT